MSWFNYKKKPIENLGEFAAKRWFEPPQKDTVRDTGGKWNTFFSEDIEDIRKARIERERLRSWTEEEEEEKEIEERVDNFFKATLEEETRQMAKFLNVEWGQKDSNFREAMDERGTAWWEI